MALTRQKKEDRVAEVKALLSNSKLTVAAYYSGTPVKQMQQLRREAVANGTIVKIVKNRLFKKALEARGFDETIDKMSISGQLMYAFNDSDETAAARTLANFAKTNPQIELACGIDNEGQVIDANDLKILADLPTKNQLRAQLIGTLNAPAGKLAGALAASNRSILYAMAARAEQLS